MCLLSVCFLFDRAILLLLSPSYLSSFELVDIFMILFLTNIDLLPYFVCVCVCVYVWVLLSLQYTFLMYCILPLNILHYFTYSLRVLEHCYFHLYSIVLCTTVIHFISTYYKSHSSFLFFSLNHQLSFKEI